MDCTITSPKETKQYKRVARVTLPAFSGVLQVLPGHAEAFMLLEHGSIEIERMNGTTEQKEIDGAECHITEDSVLIVL